MIQDQEGDTGRNALVARSTAMRPLAEASVADRLQLAEVSVSQAFFVEPEELYLTTRGTAQVSKARQVMMYLARVEFGLSLTEVAERYNRDRSTVRYACRAIEDQRDDPWFDLMICQIEAMISLSWDLVIEQNHWSVQ